MEIKAFFDPETFTLTYVVFDPASRDAVVIDPVLDYDVLSSTTATTSLEKVADFARDRELRVHYVLETHAHADHLSGSQWLKESFGARIAIGERIREVQETFKDVLDMAHLATDGSQFDRLLQDGDVIEAGTLGIEVIATPGHTPACVTYRIGDAVFTGDALFLHDYGTGRCDFPRGSAEALYDSVARRLYTLPDSTRVYPGHDYQPGGRAVAWETTIGRSKQENPQLSAATTKAEFVAMRTARDRTLKQPRLLYPSVQVNIDGGRLPPKHANGRRYLTTPIGEAPREPFAEVDPSFVTANRHLALVDVREPQEFTGDLGTRARRPAGPARQPARRRGRLGPRDRDRARLPLRWPIGAMPRPRWRRAASATSTTCAAACWRGTRLVSRSSADRRPSGGGTLSP